MEKFRSTLWGSTVKFDVVRQAFISNVERLISVLKIGITLEVLWTGVLIEFI